MRCRLHVAIDRPDCSCFYEFLPVASVSMPGSLSIGVVAMSNAELNDFSCRWQFGMIHPIVALFSRCTEISDI